jgi:hypothetical protein
MSLLNRTIANIFEINQIDDEVFGVEVELEASSDFPQSRIVGWEARIDNSLRGNSVEYVFSTPLNYEESQAAILHLYSRLAAAKTSINDSMRAGVHVHVNQSNRTFREVLTFLCCYWLVEDKLTAAHCGEERIGNAFCLRLTDASYPLSYLTNRLTGKKRGHPISRDDRDSLRYSAANIASLTSFGTIEFRALKSPMTGKPLLEWLRALNNILQVSKTFTSPKDIVESCSGTGVINIASRIAPSVTDFDENELMESLRRLQFLAYSVNWE